MRKLICCFYIFLATIICGCSSTKQSNKSKSNANANGQLTEEQQINTYYAFFNAIKEKQTGNPEKAAELFAQVLRLDPNNDASMYELASLYNEGKKYNDALFFAKNAVEINSDNEWYQLLLADCYIKTGAVANAGKIYELLSKKYPSNIDYLFQLAETQLMSEKINDAIATYNLIETRIGVSRELTSQKQRLYLKLGKIDDAANEIEKLIASDPKNLEYFSMLVDLYQANSIDKKVLETVQRMQAIDPANPTIALALAEHYRNQGKKEESYSELKKAFESKQLSVDYKIRILTSYLPLVEGSEEMMNQALELSKIMSNVHPSEANPQAVYGDFLAIHKESEAARKQYRLSLTLDKKNIQAWQQLLMLNAEIQDYQSLEKESTEALELFPDQSVFYLFNGIAKVQNKNYESGAKSLLTGSKMVVDNDVQLLEFYSNLGEVYDKLKKFDDSDKYYEKALKLEPNNAFILNNWAYYLSLRKVNLEKAAEMSKKSNEITTNNSSYLDTYAWILFEQGKYQDALGFIEQALQFGGKNNGTILEHYGDILYKLGQIEKAVLQWKLAKETGEYSLVIDKKIVEKKWYE